MPEKKSWFEGLKPVTPAAERMQKGPLTEKEKQIAAFLKAMRKELETAPDDAQKQEDYLSQINTERQSRGAKPLESVIDFDNSPEYTEIKGVY